MEFRSALCRAAVVVALVAVGSVVATPSVAQADVTRIGTYLEVGNGGLGELHPDVAYSNKSNAYLVVWGDGAGGDQRPTFAQLVSGAGALVGPRLQLTSCGGELYGQRPRVTYTTGTTDDVFVVLYREWCGGAVNVFAHAVRYTANGAVSVARASVATSGSPGGIVYNAQRGELVAVWEDYGGAATEFDAYGRVLTLTRDGNGAVTGFAPFAPPIAVGQFAKTQGRPRIALDPGTQSYLIAFQGENPTTGAVALMYRTLDAASGAMSGLLYAAQGSYNVESSVVFLPEAGEFLITWRQVSDIVGRRFAPVTGAPTSGTYPLLATPGTDGATGAAYDATGNAGMVAGMNSDYTVWASEFGSSGAFVSAFRASSAPPTPPGGGTFFPQVTATGSGVLALTYGLDYKQVFIERFSADGAGGGPPPPPPPPPPAPLSVTSLAANKSFPIALGTSVTFTATATGGTSPYTYRFVTYNASTGWAIIQDYSTFNTFTYFPAAGTNAVQVWVRNAGSTANYDAYLSSGYFTVNAATPVITSFTANKTFPQPINSLITFTATVTGGTNPQYRFVTYNASTGWAITQDYGALNTFSYYPASGTNAVQVWVRNTGSTADYEAYQSSGYFQITGATPVVVTSLAADKTFPQPVNSLVTFSATATGGTGSLRYRFVTYNSSVGWTIAQDYGPHQTFAYYPGVGTNAVQVWVRSQGSTADYDAYRSSGFFTITSLNPPTGVTLTPLQSFPAPYNTLVSFTASAVGGSNVQYRFVTYNQATGWAITQDYSALNTFAYYPAAGTNAVQVWVRNAGSTADYEAWSSSGYFNINP